MTDGQPRTREQRKVDTLAKLAVPAVDVWVTPAPRAPAGRPLLSGAVVAGLD